LRMIIHKSAKPSRQCAEASNSLLIDLLKFDVLLSRLSSMPPLDSLIVFPVSLTSL